MDMSHEVVAFPANSTLTESLTCPPMLSSSSSLQSSIEATSASSDSAMAVASPSFCKDALIALPASSITLFNPNVHAFHHSASLSVGAASSHGSSVTFALDDKENQMAAIYQEKEMNGGNGSTIVSSAAKLSNTSNIHHDRPHSYSPTCNSSCPAASSTVPTFSPASSSASSSCLSSARCVSCCRSGFYLCVAVGGRRNYLFQEDNITPAGSPESTITRAIKEERLKMEAKAEGKIAEVEESHGPKIVQSPAVSQPTTARSSASSCASASEELLEEDGMDEPTSPLSASSNSSLSSSDARSHRADDAPDEMDLSSSPQSSLQSLPSQTQTQEMSPSLVPHIAPHSFSSAANPLTLSPSTTREKRRKKTRQDDAPTSSPDDSEEESEVPHGPFESGDDADKKQAVLRRQTTRHTMHQRTEKTLLQLRAADQEKMRQSLSSPNSARFADDYSIEVQNERIKIHSYSGMPLHVAGGYGQDAFYISGEDAIHSETSEPVLLLSLGVADGVGGWRSTGVDSGKMAQAMMKNCLQMVHDRLQKSSQYIAQTYAPNATNCRDDVLYSPADMMARAYYDIQERRSVDAGSTTACVVHLLPNCLYESLMQRRKQQLHQHLEPGLPNHAAAEIKQEEMKESENQMDANPTNSSALPSAPPASAVASTSVDPQPHTHNANGCTMLCANLGDSGFTLYRNSSVVVQCEYQRDESGVVKQLAMIPEAIAKTPEAYEYCQDSPTEASISNHRVSVNDIIILASDGLWDNICEPFVSFAHPFAGLLRVKANLDVNAVSRTRRMQKVVRKIIKNAMKEEELANRQRFDEKTRVGESILECKEAEEESDEDDDDNASDEAIHQREFQAFACGKEVDVRRICAGLVKHAAEYMKTFEGKPDDLTVMVAQLRRHVPEPCGCACHQMKKE